MFNAKEYVLKGGKIFTSFNVLEDHSIVVKNGMIREIVKNSEIDRSLEVINIDGLNISAGFVDLQINGCGGVLFNDDISESTLKTMHQTNLKFGCTSFLPTLITTSEENIKKAVQIVAKFREKKPHSVIGIHIEGPYISKIKKGIHNPIYMQPMSDDMKLFLCEWAKCVPIKITMAPEENSVSTIRELVNAGLKVSIGHTNATYEQAEEAIEAGASFATHLFNAMSAFEGRTPNTVGAVLNSDVYAGVIIDGFHVHYKSLEIVKKIKQDKLFIVTDAVTPLGTDLQSFEFADQLIYAKDGKCVNSEGTLAGANIDMLSSVKNAVNHVGISLVESLKMASLYPAKAIGCSNILGKISKECVANLAIFDNDFTLHYTVDNGQIMSYIK